jgi:hypothetical protein
MNSMIKEERNHPHVLLNQGKALKSGRGEVFPFGRGIFDLSPITSSLFCQRLASRVVFHVLSKKRKEIKASLAVSQP